MRNETSENSPNWISNKYSQQLVHKIRTVEEAILVGTNTAINDNPTLNVRKWNGDNPVRVVLDKSLKIPASYHIYDDKIKTIIFTDKKPKTNSFENLFFEKINFYANLPNQVCDVLYKHEIQSVIIEGGAKTTQSFIDEDLWDEANVFVGDVKFTEGLQAPQIKKAPVEIKKISTDTLKIFKN